MAIKKTLLVLTWFAVSVTATETLNVFGHKWSVPHAADWKVTDDNGKPVLHLATAKEPEKSGPRRPVQFAIAETPEFRKVIIDADMRALQRSLIIVYDYRDAGHFNYAHLSVDTGTKQPNHNGIFHVYAGERVRISALGGPPALAESGRWHHVRLDYDGTSGEINVAVDGMKVPALRGIDLSLRSGKIGLGSFDETAEFRNVKVAGEPEAGAK